ncbi:hypothetical protein COT68_02595 [bacterium (Candidatus Torokbacteria) CG09_land_8_20_14_0_10_42_11]|nr:MAG: hypothetical protein COT68_02595 [bacterium (Candidatus Torokbacteria) CG09_land_8_20_14_0_10_42_11]
MGNKRELGGGEYDAEEQPKIEETMEQPRSLLEMGRARRKEKMQKAKMRFSGLGGKIKNVLTRIGKAGSTGLDVAFATRPAAEIAGAEIKAGMKATGRGIKRGAELGGEAVVASARGAKAGVEAVGRGGKRLGSEAKGAYLVVDDWAEHKLEDYGNWQEAKYADMDRWVQDKWGGLQKKGGEIKQGFNSGVEKAKEMYSNYKESRAEAIKQRKLAELRSEMSRSVEAIKWNQERYNEARKQTDELEGIDNLAGSIEAAQAAD